ncbi:MAG: rhamnulokinase, partial [Clostridia bacterium]|nr:rhamnulokinase [Clostridia bacterium]
IGASSGRHILGSLQDGKMVLEEIYRFDNLQVFRNGHDCWDPELLYMNVVKGIAVCKELGKIPSSLSIDTWGCDYVLVDTDGNLVGDCVCHRDPRTIGIDEEMEKIVSPQEIYQRTGIQKMRFNTIYQLGAQKKEHPEQLENAYRLLMIQDYLVYRLTGKMTNEYTAASTSGLLDVRTCDWDYELIGKFGFPKGLFQEITMPGENLGGLKQDVQDAAGFNTDVILSASHDTGNAYLSVPAREGETSVYLSSGTWSLLGVENKEPITTEESRLANYTNEGGAWKRYRYLKNIMGLWIIQSVRRELNGVNYVEGREHRVGSGKTWSFPELIAEAQKYADFPSCVDVDKSRFLAPESMITEIQYECRETCQAVPTKIGQVVKTVYNSLSTCYRDYIRKLEKVTGKKYEKLRIVGGGSQDAYLNQMTANACGIPVEAGPVEGTAIGNLMVQMIADGELSSLDDGRDCVRRSFPITTYLPEQTGA